MGNVIDRGLPLVVVALVVVHLVFAALRWRRVRRSFYYERLTRGSWLLLAPLPFFAWRPVRNCILYSASCKVCELRSPARGVTISLMDKHARKHAASAV